MDKVMVIYLLAITSIATLVEAVRLISDKWPVVKEYGRGSTTFGLVYELAVMAGCIVALAT